MLESMAEREAFWKELVAAREQERLQAIADGKMDDPTVQKRLEDAITIVGTCPDMCPRFERYRRERENNLYEFETIPGTKRVDHQKAVKIYERGAGDKVLPSDLRPPRVLKKTLDYLFHDLLPQHGLNKTASFIRDRSRAVRNDFTMQHLNGPVAIDCYCRCARFHILVLHHERETPGFSKPMEEQQLMNSLQSLKEFYEEQKDTYQSPTELEMRVYHRLAHIRDQRPRAESIPEHITNNPVFKLVSQFRLHVQEKSAPIRKNTPLIVDEFGMQLFSQVVGLLREEGNTIMIYLLACILEWLFGPDKIDNIESIKGDLTLPQIIDGPNSFNQQYYQNGDEQMNGSPRYDEELELEPEPEPEPEPAPVPPPAPAPIPATTSVFGTTFPSQPTQPVPVPPPMARQQKSAFETLLSSSASTTNVFGTTFGESLGSSSTSNLFGGSKSVFGAATSSFSNSAPTSVFGQSTTQPSAPTSTTQPSASSNVFGSAPLTTKPTIPLLASANQPSSSIFGTFGAFPSASTTTQPKPITPSPTPPPSSFFSAPAPQAASTKPLPTPPTLALNPQAPSFTPSLPSSSSSLFQQPLQRKPSLPSLPQTVPQSLAQTEDSTKQPKARPSLADAPPLGSNASSSSPSPVPVAISRSSASSSHSRTATPPPLKIDTDFASTSTPPAFPSPREPPALGKLQPISLPSTPTTAPPPSALLSHIKQNLTSPSGGSGSAKSGPLSPLVIQSPSVSPFPSATFGSFGIQQTSMSKGNEFALGLLKINGKGKGKEKEKEPMPVPSPAQPLSVPVPQKAESRPEVPAVLTLEQREERVASSRKKGLVKSCYGEWRRRADERKAYYEACEREEAYREKQQRKPANEKQAQKEQETPDRKRRMSDALQPASLSPRRKRPRKRVSSVYKVVLTDEEQAARFGNNKHIKERQWKAGTFLELFKAFLAQKAPRRPTRSSTLSTPSTLEDMPAIWSIWVSELIDEPEYEVPSIWIQKKFVIPESGYWDKGVFSIPLSTTSRSGDLAFPGIVVFQCTPMDGLVEKVDRMRCIVEDCERLREVARQIPSRRFYNPALLTIRWTKLPEGPDARDFDEMVDELVKSGVFKSHVMLPIAFEDDSDAKLASALQNLSLDVVGERVQSLTVSALVKAFLPQVMSLVTEWVISCRNGNNFNWKLYNLVVHACVDLLNDVIQRVASLCDVPESAHIFYLPDFEDSGIVDSLSAYERVHEYLSDGSFECDVSHIISDLRSYANIEQEFPVQTFPEHLAQLVPEVIEQLVRPEVQDPRPSQSTSSLSLSSTASRSMSSMPSTQPAQEFLVLTEDLVGYVTEFDELLQPWRIKLSQRLNNTARRSPKRRSGSTGTRSDASFLTPESKRARLSTPSTVDGDLTPYSSPHLNGNASIVSFGQTAGHQSPPNGAFANGHPVSPSPTQSMVSLPASEPAQPAKPVITAAMLRALTKDLKRKYMGAS